MIKSLFKKHLWLILILALALFLRTFRLASIPPAISWDEAAIGWNAKTIFHTRRDEYGTRLPFTFKSFGDYKAPLYIYLTSPFVGLFTITPITIRIVSAISGLVIVFFTYLLGKKLFNLKIGLIAALITAISPWSIMMSRGAFEQNLALALIAAGTYFFLLGLKKPLWLLISAVLFVLSLYSYHSPKIFVPIFILGLVYLYRQPLFTKAKLKSNLLITTLSLLLLFPLVRSALKEGGAERFKGTSIFYQSETPILPTLISNYFSHYHPSFLFKGGVENYRQQMQEVGPLLLIQLPFLLFGLIQLIKQRGKREYKLLAWWFIVGPIAAAIGIEAPHQIRSFNIFPAITLISAVGVTTLIKNPKAKLLTLLILIVNFGYFGYNYINKYPVYSASDWQYGYTQAAQIARFHEDQVDKIILTSEYGQPYIFTMAIQNRRPLAVFWGGMSKYLYRTINWDEDPQKINTLIIGSPQEIPADAENLIETINFPDGTPVFRVVKTPDKS